MALHRFAIRAAVFVSLMIGSASTVVAQETASLRLGRSTDVNAVQGALAWSGHVDDPRWRWLAWTGAVPRLEATASLWNSQSTGPTNGTLFGVGLQPVLRWNLSPVGAGRPFIDFGLGPRLWSGTSIGSGKRFGTAFEFGTVLGVGLQRDRYDLFVRVEHTSNGGIRQPNPGIDFLLIGVSWRLQP